jgi:hypothetical protein
MTKRLFIWVAHPKAGSLCAAIADSYQAGAPAPRVCSSMNSCPAAWNIGVQAYSTVSGPMNMADYRNATIIAPANWLRTTPLGVPVVPEV